MPIPMIQSMAKKKIAVIKTMMPTITDVIQVSFQLVQVTFRLSASTSRRNWAGFTRFFAGASGGPPPFFTATKGVLRRIAL